MTGCSERWTLLLPDKKPCLVGRQTMNYDYEGKYSTSHGRREREGQDEGGSDMPVGGHQPRLLGR